MSVAAFSFVSAYLGLTAAVGPSRTVSLLIGIASFVLLAYNFLLWTEARNAALKRAEGAESNLLKCRSIIRTVSSMNLSKYSERKTYRFIIGTDDNGDSFERIYLTTPDMPIAWRTLAYGNTIGAPEYSSFTPLSPRVELKAPGHEGHFLPTHESSTELDASVFFTPPIDNRFQWSVTCKWPGMWRELRKNGRAEGDYSARSPEDERVELQFIYPPTWQNVQLIPSSKSGTVVNDSTNNRTSWILDHPTGTYRYVIKAHTK
jgi:hypothetical protein